MLFVLVSGMAGHSLAHLLIFTLLIFSPVFVIFFPKDVLDDLH